MNRGEIFWNVIAQRVILPYPKILWCTPKSRASQIGGLNMARLIANPKYKSKSDSELSTARES